MRIMILLLILTMCLLFACSEGGAVSEPSPVPPQEPATPQAPLRERSERPATAKPADTPKPAATPALAAPVAVLPTYIPEPSATNASIPMATAAPLAPALAVLPAYTPEPSPTSIPIPTATPVSAEVKQELRNENLQRCRHWALKNLSTLLFNEFDNLNPYDMTDLQRSLWSEELHGGFSTFSLATDRGGLVAEGEGAWCLDYWSEELSVSNASKRNDQFYDACQVRLVRSGVSFERDMRNYYGYEEEQIDMSPIMINQRVRILNWLDISGEELLNMDIRPDELIRRLIETVESRYIENRVSEEWPHLPRKGVATEVLEWWGIEGLSSHFPNCELYYPQLFFGRWIPVDTYGLDSHILRYAEALESARDRDDWPDWADQKNRDVLIRLEN